MPNPLYDEAKRLAQSPGQQNARPPGQQGSFTAPPDRGTYTPTPNKTIGFDTPPPQPLGGDAPAGGFAPGGESFTGQPEFAGTGGPAVEQDYMGAQDLSGFRMPSLNENRFVPGTGTPGYAGMFDGGTQANFQNAGYGGPAGAPMGVGQYGGDAPEWADGNWTWDPVGEIGGPGRGPGLGEGSVDVAGSIAGAVPSAAPGRDGYIDDYLDQVFGEGGSFDPTRDLMEEERDRAYREMAEMMAGRGMSQTGAAAGQMGDIYRGYSRDLAQAHQDWRQQEIQNKAQAAGMLFQDEWKQLDREHQQAMAELMYELDRKQKYGEDYNPNIGDYEAQMLRDLMNSDNLSPEMKEMLEYMLTQLYGEDVVNDWKNKAGDAEEERRKTTGFDALDDIAERFGNTFGFKF
ncbi:MAG: hypothetical protein R6U98_06565 [Pirellulaceae bacterium]